jgi:septal ring factor EnvC (AmiA/AmiB activator)
MALEANSVTGFFFFSVYHYYDVNIKRKMMGQGKSNRTKFVNPDEAVQLGAEIFGEFALYSILVGLVIIEYNVSSRNSKKEKEREKNEMQQYFNGLERNIVENDLNVAKMEAEIRELQRAVGDLSSQCYSLEQKLDKGRKK